MFLLQGADKTCVTHDLLDPPTADTDAAHRDLLRWGTFFLGIPPSPVSGFGQVGVVRGPDLATGGDSTAERNVTWLLKRCGWEKHGTKNKISLEHVTHKSPSPADTHAPTSFADVALPGLPPLEYMFYWCRRRDNDFYRVRRVYSAYDSAYEEWEDPPLFLEMRGTFCTRFCHACHKRGYEIPRDESLDNLHIDVGREAAFFGWDRMVRAMEKIVREQVRREVRCTDKRSKRAGLPKVTGCAKQKLLASCLKRCLSPLQPSQAEEEMTEEEGESHELPSFMHALLEQAAYAAGDSTSAVGAYRESLAASDADQRAEHAYDMANDLY